MLYEIRRNIVKKEKSYILLIESKQSELAVFALLNKKKIQLFIYILKRLSFINTGILEPRT